MKLIKTLGLVITLITIAQACTIKITPEKTTGAIDEEIKVKISVQNQHIPCPLEINRSEILVSGGSIVSQTPWKKISGFEFEKQLMIKLTGPDKTTISLKRICDIKTSQASVTIEVKGNNFTSLSLSVKETTTKLLEGLIKLSTLRNNLITLSSSEKEPEVKKKISGLVTQLDSVLKYSKRFAIQCSLLLKGL